MWEFTSPSRGAVTLEAMVDDIRQLADRYPRDRFRIIIGTDSQPHPGSRRVTFVTAVIVHHVGKGARYYIHREHQSHMYSLRQRMFAEAAYSLQVGGLLTERLGSLGDSWRPEVHVDVGERGATRQLIREIVAWIMANGYEAHIKPDAFAASKVADRYTKA